MNKRQVKTFFDNLTYKDVHYEYSFQDGQLVVTGSRKLVDPKNKREITAQSEETFNYKRVTSIQLLSAMRDWIHAAERHEADEWLHYRGVAVFHPHKAKVTLY